MQRTNGIGSGVKIMAHWVDTYPHDVYASVLLLDGEIYNWKIGQRYWKSPWDMTWRFPLPDNMDKFTVETKNGRLILRRNTVKYSKSMQESGSNNGKLLKIM